MRWKSRNNDLRNVAALTAAALVHATGVYFLAAGVRIAPRQSERDPSRSEPVTIWFDADKDRNERRLGRKRRLRSGNQAKVPPSNSEAGEVHANTEMATDPPMVDWSVASEHAAAIIVARASSPDPGSLDSKPKRSIPKPEVFERGIFDRGPAHRPGTMEDHGEGIYVTWVSAYCYAISSMTFEGRKESIRCQKSPAEAGSTELFKDLTPRYLLKPLPMPKSSAGEMQSQEPVEGPPP